MPFKKLIIYITIIILENTYENYFVHSVNMKGPGQMYRAATLHICSEITAR